MNVLLLKLELSASAHDYAILFVRYDCSSLIVKSTICSSWSSLAFLKLDLSNLLAFSAAFSPSDLKYCSNHGMWLLTATIFQNEIIIAFLFCRDIALVWYIPTYFDIKHSYCYHFDDIQHASIDLWHHSTLTLWHVWVCYMYNGIWCRCFQKVIWSKCQWL